MGNGKGWVSSRRKKLSSPGRGGSSDIRRREADWSDWLEFEKKRKVLLNMKRARGTRWREGRLYSVGGNRGGGKDVRVYGEPHAGEAKNKGICGDLAA